MNYINSPRRYTKYNNSNHKSTNIHQLYQKALIKYVYQKYKRAHIQNKRSSISRPQFRLLQHSTVNFSQQLRRFLKFFDYICTSYQETDLSLVCS